MVIHSVPNMSIQPGYITAQAVPDKPGNLVWHVNDHLHPDSNYTVALDPILTTNCK